MLCSLGVIAILRSPQKDGSPSVQRSAVQNADSCHTI